MTTTLKQYLIADFDKISNEGIVYTLDASVLSIIQQLNNQVSSPDYGNASRVDEKRLHETFHVKRHGGRTHHDKEFDIKISTNQHLIKKDTDLRADTIRKLLNKITSKTYNELFPALILEFDKILELQDDDKRGISMLVLSIVSETSFYSDMYAMLYTYLLEHYDFLREEMNNRVNTFKQWVGEITYYNPDTDYDLFCNNNKTNLKRKSVGVFLVNLAKLKVVEVETVCDIIVHIQEIIMTNLDEENKSEIIVELSEIAGDMIIAGKKFLHKSKLWNTIIGNINTLSSKKPKEHRSLSTKAIFKNMDLRDFIG